MQPLRLIRSPWLMATFLTLLVTACMPVQPATQGQATVPVEQSVITSTEQTAAPSTDATQDAGTFPATIDNCGIKTTYTAAPKAAVSVNQAATEIMLSLGLQASMVGTAYLDDAVAPALQAAYESVPVLSDEYPS